jgi:hypothetical protein
MSASAMSRIMDVQVDGMEKSVLMYLADQASQEGVVFMPPIDRIARVTCWSPPDVVRALTSLRSTGHLRDLSAAELRSVPPPSVGQSVYMLEPNPA